MKKDHRLNFRHALKVQALRLAAKHQDKIDQLKAECESRLARQEMGFRSRFRMAMMLNAHVAELERQNAGLRIALAGSTGSATQESDTEPVPRLGDEELTDDRSIREMREGVAPYHIMPNGDRVEVK